MKPTVRPNDWWADEGRQGYGSPMWWPGSLRKCLIRSASNHERLIWPGIRSFADTAANGELAPIPAVRVLMNGRLTTPSSHHEKGLSCSAFNVIRPDQDRGLRRDHQRFDLGKIIARC